LQPQLQISKHSSMAQSELDFCHTIDGWRHMPPTPNAVQSETSSSTLEMCRETLKSVHYSYRQPLCQSLIVIKDEMLIFHKPIQGSTSYTRLQIVPKGLYDIVFIAFHSNPIGGHLNA
jgi:hypothetical protein